MSTVLITLVRIKKISYVLHFFICHDDAYAIYRPRPPSTMNLIVVEDFPPGTAMQHNKVLQTVSCSHPLWAAFF